MIIAENITKQFGDLKVLKGINLKIEEGEIVSIVGASGAGKTTLLQILGTLDRPTSGTVRYEDVEVFGLNDTLLARFRNRRIGFVFQFHHLLPEFTALENVCMPAYIAGMTRSRAEKRARELIGFLGLGDRCDHKPSELSGGEQQRVAVARALMNEPDVVLADEPSGNLDSRNKKELHELFLSLRKQYNQTLVLVTHDKDLAGMADRMLTIRDGVIG